VDEKAAAAFRAMMDRAVTKTAADGVRMKTEAERKRAVAAHLARTGDAVGSSFELAEARRLDEEADLVLDPIVHAMGPATISAGGEIAHGSNRLADVARMPVDMVTIDASQERLALTEKVNVTTLALDIAQTIQATNSAEKMLAAQLAGAHALAMELLGQSRQLLRRFETAGSVALSVESARLANAATRMMDSYQGGLATIARLRGGGQQVVVVKHVQQISAGQAVIGTVTSRPRRTRGGGGTGQK
jgi:hypothetical protein